MAQKRLLAFAVLACLPLLVMFSDASEAETLSLAGATAYDPGPSKDNFGLAWSLSTGTIDPTGGQISHNSCALAAYFGVGSIFVYDGIRSAEFTVGRSGRYKLHLYGSMNGEIREGSSAGLTGVSKSGGKLLIGGGFTSAGLEQEVLHETDFSIWALVTEMAWATWNVFLDRIDETGVASELLLSIKDAIASQRTWNSSAFNLYSYTNLEAGVPYQWAFFVSSTVSAGAFGIDVREVSYQGLF